MHMTHDLLDPNPTNTTAFIMMSARTYSTKNTWYVEYEVTGPPGQSKKDEGKVIQILAVPGTAKSTNHKSNVLDLIKQMYPKATALAEADIGVTKTSEARILQTIAEQSQYLIAIPKRKQSASDLKLLYKFQEPLRQCNNDKRKRSWRRHVTTEGRAPNLPCTTLSLFGNRLI
jgi:hypothetical protein